MRSLLRILRRISSQLCWENLHWVAFVLLALILVAAVAFWYFEEKLGFFDAFWWSVVTVTTVGYGDISPATPAGRFVGIALMMLGIGFLGVLTATIASHRFYRKQVHGEQGYEKSNSEGTFCHLRVELPWVRHLRGAAC